MLIRNIDPSRMLNKITILQRVGIPVVADWLMVGSRTSAIREIPSVQGIKLNLRLHRIRKRHSEHHYPGMR